MSNALKTILSLCDYSGNWPYFYREAGYNVVCIDIKRGKDVRLLEKEYDRVHGILAAPDCTKFANSGARWKRREAEIKEALALVDACLRAVVVYRPKFWALENPIGKLSSYLGEPVFRFNPCDFGDPYTKRTCLWGDFVIPQPLFVTPQGVKPINGSMMWSKFGGKSERTKEARSITPLGFARAFFEANQ
jgi:hypothetical protein